MSIKTIYTQTFKNSRGVQLNLPPFLPIGQINLREILNLEELIEDLREMFITGVKKIGYPRVNTTVITIKFMYIDPQPELIQQNADYFADILTAIMVRQEYPRDPYSIRGISDFKTLQEMKPWSNKNIYIVVAPGIEPDLGQHFRYQYNEDQLMRPLNI